MPTHEYPWDAYMPATLLSSYVICCWLAHLYWLQLCCTMFSWISNRNSNWAYGWRVLVLTLYIHVIFMVFSKSSDILWNLFVPHHIIIIDKDTEIDRCVYGGFNFVIKNKNRFTPLQIDCYLQVINEEISINVRWWIATTCM